MAGNIIPAIASTNAVVAGLIVLEAYKVLRNKDSIRENCRNVYISRVAAGRTRLLTSIPLPFPNPNCFVCAPRPEAVVLVDTATFTLGALVNSVLKGALHMQAPDVTFNGW